MKRIGTIFAILLLSMQMAVYAHGNMDHVLGTVKSIAGNTITVEKDGTTTEVVLTATTTWEFNGQPGKQADLKVGDRVVIHALKVNGKETAHEVRYAHAGGTK
jgi:ribosomal protein S1